MPLQEAIKISTDTKSLLDNLKIVEMDTYDAVIKRLIGHYAEGMTDINKETKDLLLQQIRRINEGKVKSFNQVLKEFKNMKKKRTSNEVEGGETSGKERDRRRTRPRGDNDVMGD